MKLNKKVAAGLAAGAVVVAGSGVAYAYWTTTGSGSGNSTSSATPASVTYHASFDAATLAPGTSVSVAYSASNASPTILQVAAPTATFSSNKTVDGLAMAANKSNSCAQYLSLSAQPTGGQVPAHTAAGDGSVSLGSATLSFDDSTTDNQNLCQGQTVTISLSN
ncbi:MAG: hypothetical protein QOC82_438 [Frankiaceae bacterium]|jgi:hypothetical protein|nr:hypothetical protein [Frankiaceae bacterium]